MSRKINITGYIVSNEDYWFYSYYGYECVCPKQLEKALLDARGEDVEIWINSPGGYVSAGSEMYTLISQYKGSVVNCAVGEVCSAAAFILCAAYSVGSPTVRIMIHNASGGAQGDYHVMDTQSDCLQKANISIANALILKTGKTQQEILEAMDRTTWMTVQDAVDFGILDGIMENKNTNYIPKKTGIVLMNAFNMMPELTEDMRKTAAADINSRNAADRKKDALSDITILENNSISASQKQDVLNMKMIKNKEENAVPEKETKTVEQLAENKESAETAAALKQTLSDLAKQVKDAATLKQVFPNLAKQVENEAVEAERKRMQDIEDISAGVTDEALYAAKYENPITAAELALKTIKESSAAGAAAFKSMVDGIKNSGAENVSAECNGGLVSEQGEEISVKKEKAKGLAEVIARKQKGE